MSSTECRKRAAASAATASAHARGSAAHAAVAATAGKLCTTKSRATARRCARPASSASPNSAAAVSHVPVCAHAPAAQPLRDAIALLHHITRVVRAYIGPPVRTAVMMLLCQDGLVSAACPTYQLADSASHLRLRGRGA